MDKELIAGLSPAYALTQGKLPIAATVDMLKNGLGGSDNSKELETENEKYKKQLADMQAAQTGQVGQPVKPMKKGGSVSKMDMQKAGFYDKGKTKKEQQDIVKKVTTKPQRVAIVSKAFSTKNMNKGGSVSSASKRADGCCVKGKTKGRYL